MPRNSRQRGGSRHSKGRGGGRSAAPVGRGKSRRNNLFLESFVQEEGENAALHIGGGRVHCDTGNVQHFVHHRAKQARKSQSQRLPRQVLDGDDSTSTVDTETDSEADEDYIANVMPSSSDSASGQEQDHFLLASLDGPPAETVHGAAEGLSDFSDDSAESSSEDDSEAEGSSDAGSDVSIDDVITDLEDGLSLMDRYPVLLNEKPPGSNAQGFSFKKQNRGAVRGAKNGKLLPGEKKRLKREKMQAKRAARASSSGLDLESINAQLVQFVATGGDMKGFPCMKRYGLQAVMKLASCYGLKASAQGSGKKQFVVVASCERTSLPSGEAAEEVRRILGQQRQFEAAMRAVNLGSRTGSKTGNKSSRRSHGQSSQTQPVRYNEPVRFVSSGHMAHDTVEIRPALRPLATALASSEEQPADAVQSDASLAENADTAAVLAEDAPVGAKSASDAQTSARLTADERTDAMLADAAQAQSRQQHAGQPSDAAVSRSDAEAQHGDIAASVPEAPWNLMVREDEYDAAEPVRLGLGCAPLPQYKYQEEATIGLGAATSSRPMYDRFAETPLGSLEDQPPAHISDPTSQTAGASEDEDVVPVPYGGYIHERRPDLPALFMTKQEVKRSKKKQEKLARRAERQGVLAAGYALTPQPTAVATGLHYGKFEQHTTGYGSLMLAKWGFQGQGSGLGRDDQGIAEPIHAHVRAKRQGLGN